MSTGFASRAVHCSIASLVLALALGLGLGALTFEALANPVLTDEKEDSSLQGEDLEPELFKGASQSERPLATPQQELEAFRFDDAAPAESLWTSTGMPVQYGSPFGQRDALLNQILRDFGGVNSAGAPAAGWDRGRPGRGLDASGGADLGNPLQAMYQEALNSVLRLARDSILDDKDTASFSIAGIEFTMMLSGERRGLIVHGYDLLPTILNASPGDQVRPDAVLLAATAMQGQDLRSDATGATPGSHSAIPHQPETTAESVQIMVEKVYEFLIEPITMFVVIGCAIVWLLVEVTRWVGERRRRRQWRRRSTRRAARQRA